MTTHYRIPPIARGRHAIVVNGVSYDSSSIGDDAPEAVRTIAQQAFAVLRREVMR